MLDLQRQPPSPNLPIPPELIHSILSHLHPSKRTLQSCSLISHSFLHIARLHLFDSVSIVLVHPKYNAQAFIALSKENPGLVECIREIVIKSYEFASLKSRPVLTAKTLSEIVEDLSRLKVLQLSRVRFIVDDGWSTAAEKKQIDIQELTLQDDGSPQDTIPSILSPLSVFTHVTQLNIIDVDLGPPSTEPIETSNDLTISHSILLFPSITSLLIKSVPNTAGILSAFVDAQSKTGPDWQSISVDCLSTNDVTQLGTLFRSSSQSLRAVKIDLTRAIARRRGNGDAIKEISTNLNFSLSTLSNLLSFTLVLPFHRSRNDQPATPGPNHTIFKMFTSCLRYLSTSNSKSTLRHITLSITTSMSSSAESRGVPYAARDLDWQGLRGAIAEFTHLASLSLRKDASSFSASTPVPITDTAATFTTRPPGNPYETLDKGFVLSRSERQKIEQELIEYTSLHEGILNIYRPLPAPRMEAYLVRSVGATEVEVDEDEDVWEDEDDSDED